MSVALRRSEPLVSTVRERCRVCYTCVRECPAKAIRISGGQAEVIAERCIGCGNCVRVCSQGAKRVRSSVAQVEQLLGSGRRLAACVAPSFPVEYDDPAAMVGALRALGFHQVHQVALGADLVARAYRELVDRDDGRQWIAANCPAVVLYVERHLPELVPALAPVVSPMVATARALHGQHGPRLAVVFIGPCIAKKAEAEDAPVRGSVDAVLTFLELAELLQRRGIEPGRVAPSQFDPPHPAEGTLLAIGGGLLQAAGIPEDLLTGRVVAAEGRPRFVAALRERASGDLQAALLDLLCCEGCIDGPGTTAALRPHARRARVARHARASVAGLDRAGWQRTLAALEGIDLTRSYAVEDQRIPDPSEADIDAALRRMGKRTGEDQLNCGACGYPTCREHAVAICEGLAESEMCLPYAIDELSRTVAELARSHEDLARAQTALMHSERLASMGQLAAGIAHEVNNPLGVVLMYAHLLLESLEPSSALRADVALIAEQADRCKKTVAGLLDFARQQRVARQPLDVVALVTHVARAMPPPDGITVRVEPALTDRVAEWDRDQITQVLVNLVGNGFDAMPDGGELTIRCEEVDDRVALVVRDQGVGIPREHRAKVFEPFFTTKSIGKGTGLGLAVAYGIVKMHGGDLTLRSNHDPAQGATGSEFRCVLPRRGPGEA